MLPEPYHASHLDGSYPQTFDSRLPEVVPDNHHKSIFLDQHSDHPPLTDTHELGIGADRELKSTSVVQERIGPVSHRKVVLWAIIVIALIAAIVSGSVGGVLSYRNRSVSIKLIIIEY
jgi:hypothetical protein